MRTRIILLVATLPMTVGCQSFEIFGEVVVGPAVARLATEDQPVGVYIAFDDLRFPVGLICRTSDGTSLEAKRLERSGDALVGMSGSVDGPVKAAMGWGDNACRGSVEVVGEAWAVAPTVSCSDGDFTFDDFSDDHILVSSSVLSAPEESRCDPSPSWGDSDSPPSVRVPLN